MNYCVRILMKNSSEVEANQNHTRSRACKIRAVARIRPKWLLFVTWWVKLLVSMHNQIEGLSLHLYLIFWLVHRYFFGCKIGSFVKKLDASLPAVVFSIMWTNILHITIQ